jgi:hypothetical protein
VDDRQDPIGKIQGQFSGLKPMNKWTKLHKILALKTVNSRPNIVKRTIPEKNI